MRYALTHSFDSFEEFDAFPTGWDSHFQLTRSEECRVDLGHSRGDGVLINAATLNRPSLQEGSTPRNMRTFALPIALEGSMAWLGRDTDDHSLLQFSESEELFAVANGGCSICTISLDNQIFDDLLAQRGVDASAVFRSEAVFSLSPEERRLLLRDISLLSEFLTKYGQHEIMPALSLGLQEELLGSLVDHIADSTVERAPMRLHAAAGIVRSSLAFMRDSAGTETSVEIGRALGVSQRSLEMSFKKYVGIPPKRYLKMLRLHRCREDLLAAPPGSETVGDIARRHGFWHMGQFGRDYRALFEERPKETLLRRR